MAIPDFSDQPLSMLWSLAGRKAVVTGAAQGLGRAIAMRLAEAGASVVLADQNLDLATRSASEIQSLTGHQCLAVAVDVRDVQSVRQLVSQADEQLGGLDVWVNNAGIFPNIGLFDMSDDLFESVMDINLNGTFWGAREAARIMKANQTRGVIINVLSMAAIRGIAGGLAAYVASKHGAQGLTRQMALELAAHDIRVMGVAPSYTPTEGTRAAQSQSGSAKIPSTQQFKLGRAGTPDDIARATLFCASDMSAFMTGSTLLIDGGNAA